jgi:hypothetical protein
LWELKEDEIGVRTVCSRWQVDAQAILFEVLDYDFDEDMEEPTTVDSME